MKKYLFLAATSALMFASCSDDITNEGNGTISSDDALKLSVLTNQQSRAKATGAETRGVKADRLQLVATIAPVETAADHHWSATGITFSGGNAYVSWHSNHQAKTSADQWGGAIDQLNIQAILDGDAAGIITKTVYAPTMKFNNVVADGGNLYVPATCYNNGAVVGRIPAGGEAIDTISVPGASANSVVVKNGTVYAVSGYAGGVYSMEAGFSSRDDFKEVVAYADDFGGKYLTDKYILGSNADGAYLRSLDAPATVRSLGEPLTSQDKYAEAYDPAHGEWYPLTGDKVNHYGKHTMAVDNAGYIYVGGGLGKEGKNGLRVYAENGGDQPVWENGTNTTAVTVDDKYVYAATGAGLRVYEKYNETDKDLKLYAYEVKEYEGGQAVGYQAGTSALSSNFVAVHQNGLIFVAAGQTGVLVFRIDENAAPKEMVPVTLTIPAIDYTSEAVEVEKGESATFTIPATKPTEEDKDFQGWATNPSATTAEYQPGDEISISGDTTLYPVWKAHEYAVILSFNGNAAGTDIIASSVPATIKSDSRTVVLPNVTPKQRKEEKVFITWSTDKDVNFLLYTEGYKEKILPGQSYTAPEGVKEVTLYAIWATNATAGGNQGGEEEKPVEPEPENPTGQGSDVGPGRI